MSTPIRRMGPLCCAPAASGHATAPPTSPINSRRFMAGSAPKNPISSGRQISTSNGLRRPLSDKDLLRLLTAVIGPGCVKSHKLAKSRKYNSPTQHEAALEQHDLTLMMRKSTEII